MRSYATQENPVIHVSMPRRQRRRGHRWALLAAMLLLAGCATAPRPQQPDDTALREFTAQGYAPVEQQPAVASEQPMLLAGQALRAALLRPQRPGPWPLVLYLPTMGEPGDAGAAWRNAWVAAGYAVLSVQALTDDALAWSSELARDGDFHQLGLARYGAAAMTQRLQVLAAVVAEGRRRTVAGDPAWAGIDWQRLAVAGFDLGAYTAMVLAGERLPGVEQDLRGWPLRAVIALSPHASLSAGALDSRFAEVRLPVLSVTSDVDSDPLGLVENAYLREAPFDRMPSTDKLLLSLRGLPHAYLGGGAPPPGSHEGHDGHAAAPEGGSGHHRGGKRGSGSVAPSRSDAPDAESDAGGGLRPRQPLSGNALQMLRVAVQAVSTAFLDAELKADPLARDWLARDAARWLGKAGTLRRK